MKFDLKKKQKPKEMKEYSKTDTDIAFSFAKTVYKEFGTLVKAIILFGSTATQDTKEKGDIDMLIVVDDVSFILTPELVETYRIIVEKTIANISTKIHVTTLKFTSFWEYVRIGDPIIINMLRSGVALIDTGMFYPLQLLLFQGRVRPTAEAVQMYFSRAAAALHNSKGHLIRATMDLYWSAIDAAHAALMAYGEMPPSPKEMTNKLAEVFVNKKLLDKKYVKTMQKFYELSRGILHRKISNVSSKDFDSYLQEVQDFVSAMKNLIEQKQKEEIKK